MHLPDNRTKVHATIRCPYRLTPYDDPCEAPVHLVIDPPERPTRTDPGNPASIEEVSGCYHAADLSEDTLLNALADQEDLVTPRDRDDWRY